MAGTNSGIGKRKRHAPEEVVAKLRQVDEQLAVGKSIADASKAIGVSPAVRGGSRSIAGASSTARSSATHPEVGCVG